MAIKILPLEEEDVTRFFEILCLAFANDHLYMDLLFPHKDTPAGRLAGAERYLQKLTTTDYTHFIKAVDEETGQIVGASVWNVYGGKIPPVPEREEDELPSDKGYWGTEEERLYACKLLRSYLSNRRAAIEEYKGDVICLELMMIDPSHQRRFIGQSLCSYGTNLADERSVPLIVESSDKGQGMYEKMGFVKRGWVKTGVEPDYHWMVREPRGKKEGEGQVDGSGNGDVGA